MNKKIILGKTILSAVLLICSLNSCKNESKITDSKEVAEEQNEAKFEDTKSKEDDSHYLVDAAETDMKGIEIGKLAQQKATDPEVKNFGKMLVDNHTKSLGTVKILASRKNISLPASLTEKGKEAYNKLNEKSGIAFDKKFSEMMVEGHEKMIEKMNKVAEKATDEEIRVWASNKISTLTTHLEHAKKMKRVVDAIK